MVRKTIKAILRRKLNNWISSIEDEEIKLIIKNNTIITGGSIVSLLQNEKPKDYDIYFQNRESAYKVAKYYTERFNQLKGEQIVTLQSNETNWEEDNPIENRIKIIIKSSGIASEKDIEEEEIAFEDVYDTELIGEEEKDIIQKYITEADEIPDSILEKIDKKKANCNFCSHNKQNHLSNKNLCECEMYTKTVNKDSVLKKGCHQYEKLHYRPIFFTMNTITLSDNIQIVVRFFGDPNEIHKNYDFIHCTCYWQSWNNQLVLPPMALESIINKQLIYQGSKYPVCSVMRLRKFISRGWSINAGQILKILWQVSELDLSDIKILEEQLIGVDSAYFSNLINALKKQMKDKEEFVVEKTYVYSILDKIFG